ncbi:hypothetical protein C8035_v001946 [Colletotrichum spinosum]|uniref:AB hydrolase-1 domain-containing protein n=1 Tax=Colletotrichum spinosum TaxID=1347390 RepID=A0A4R8QA64_9PEZI|nr:hypothetical protein C8035_v001946 [Colletotrichum spinosum]
MADHPWTNLPSQLDHTFGKLNGSLQVDAQLRAFCGTPSLLDTVVFGWRSAVSDAAVLCTVQPGSVAVGTGSRQDAAFALSAPPHAWEQFYEPLPKPPYQSFWAMLGQNIRQDGVEVVGDENLFVSYAAIVRRVLELSHEALNGPVQEDPLPEPPLEDDPIVGKYVHVSSPVWGRTRIFYEQSGDAGRPDIVFLHTAGSDSRQYHGVMSDPRMLAKCRMTAFDLPGHGRSSPSESHIPGRYSNGEDAYVGCIAAVVRALGLARPIVCGTSMGGHVCLAVVTRADEVGVGGVIPCQACEYTDMHRQWWDKSLFVNQSLFTAEWVYGMMSPTAPRRNRDLLWHTYSSQAYGMFHGDLDFYYGGWDGRARVRGIDTKKCPVYMLTGEYDWSSTPELGAATAAKIPGAKFTVMSGLGHFPAAENPRRFVGYLLGAIDHVIESRR